MSAQTVTKKRKSADGNKDAAKKVRITKSADKPAPAKSALKKAPVEEEVVEEEEEVQKPASGSKGKKVKKMSTSKTSNGKAAEEEEKITLEEDADSDEDGAELSRDQTSALLAGFSSDEDSETEEPEKPTVDISMLPKPPKQPVPASASDPETTPGVLYIGSIPHGFHEAQMRAYFAQFGDVTHLRLARNRRTGKSQHHAFIEFASGAVAEVVRKTMDKYLMFGRVLQVRRVPQENVKEGMWQKGRVMPANKIERGQLRRGAGRERWSKRVEKEEARRAEKAEQLKALGYEFEMPGVKRVEDVPVRAEGVSLLQGEKKDNGSVVEEVKTVQAEPGADAVTETKVTKKRMAGGKPTQTKKAVKKVKA